MSHSIFRKASPCLKRVQPPIQEVVISANSSGKELARYTVDDEKHKLSVKTVTSFILCKEDAAVLGEFLLNWSKF